MANWLTFILYNVVFIDMCFCMYVLLSRVVASAVFAAPRDMPVLPSG